MRVVAVHATGAVGRRLIPQLLGSDQKVVATRGWPVGWISPSYASFVRLTCLMTIDA